MTLLEEITQIFKCTVVKLLVWGTKISQNKSQSRNTWIRRDIKIYSDKRTSTQESNCA